MDPDLEFIRRVLSGDVEAFARIVEKFQERVLRLCFSMVGPSNAEDAAQEVFLKVYKALGRFQEKSAFSTWLYAIASNHCLDMIAKKKREKTDSLDAIFEKTGDNPIKAFENQETVRALLSRLSPQEKLIVTLREIEGLNYQELAETLDISMDLVKVRLFRARKSLLDLAKKFL